MPHKTFHGDAALSPLGKENQEPLVSHQGVNHLEVLFKCNFFLLDLHTGKYNEVLLLLSKLCYYFSLFRDHPCSNFNLESYTVHSFIAKRNLGNLFQPSSFTAKKTEALSSDL